MYGLTLRPSLTFGWSCQKVRQPSEKKKNCSLSKTTVNTLGLMKFRFSAQAAKNLVTFLITYQPKKPMVLFLAQSLEEIIHSFNLVFLGRDTLDTANTLLRL